MSVDQFLLSSDTTDLNYPEIRPTLDLNFARVKALDPRITFTRSSGGSYVGADGLIKYAGVNEARFDHNPVTGESLGLLIEESRTNLLFPSVPSNNGTFGASVSVNFAISPDGGLNASLLTEDTSNGEHYVDYAAALTSGTTYTYSVFYKAGPGNRNFSLRIAGLNVAAEIVNVTFNRITSGSIINYGNGWYRAYYSFTASATGATTIRLQLHNPYNYTGDGNSGVYFWGAQLEQGFVPTSYIPTTTSSRTRAADVARITGTSFSSWYNQSQGTAYTTWQFSGRTSSAQQTVCNFSNGGSDQLIAAFASMFNTLSSNTFVASVSQGRLDIPGTPTVLTSYRSATAYAASDRAFTINGVSPTTGAGSLVTPDRLEIGAALGGGYLNGTIRRLTYWPKRLPNSQLQALTR